MRKFIIDEETLTNAVLYLETCPFKHVANIINALQVIKEYVEPKEEKEKLVTRDFKKVDSQSK